MSEVKRTYEISLIPDVKSQITFLLDEKQNLTDFIGQNYEEFLAYIDSMSPDNLDPEKFESLQTIYSLVSDRHDMIIDQLMQDKMDLKELVKDLNEIKENQDQQKWQELVDVLFSEEPFEKDFDKFKKSITEEIAGLKKELTEVLDDWRATIESGEIKELALLLEAFAKEEAEEMGESEEDQDSMIEDLLSQLGAGEARSESCACGDQCACPPEKMAGSGDACCMGAEKKSGECCGKQDPCCQSKDKQNFEQTARVVNNEEDEELTEDAVNLMRNIMGGKK